MLLWTEFPNWLQLSVCHNSWGERSQPCQWTPAARSSGPSTQRSSRPTSRPWGIRRSRTGSVCPWPSRTWAAARSIPRPSSTTPMAGQNWLSDVSDRDMFFGGFFHCHFVIMRGLSPYHPGVVIMTCVFFVFFFWGGGGGLASSFCWSVLKWGRRELIWFLIPSQPQQLYQGEVEMGRSSWSQQFKIQDYFIVSSEKLKHGWTLTTLLQLLPMILLLHHPPHPSDVHSASGLHEGCGPFQPHKVSIPPLLVVSLLAMAGASVTLSFRQCHSGTSLWQASFQFVALGKKNDCAACMLEVCCGDGS